MSANIREIAKIAGVSPATISLVLNNRKGVGKEKREHIQKILKEYGYVRKTNSPNARGRHSTRKIYIVRYSVNKKQDLCNFELDARIINCIHKICHELDFQVSIIVCNKDNFENTIASLTPEHNSGIVFIGSMFSVEQITCLNRANFHGIPVIVVDNYMMHTHISSVCPDNYNISCMAVRHLHSLDIQTASYLCGEFRTPKLCDRERGFYQSIERLNMQADQPIILPQDPEKAFEDMVRFLKSGVPLPQAFYAETGPLAMIAIRALHELGKRIPEEIYIICGDDTLTTALTLPGIAVISISYEDICRIALNLLRDQLNSNGLSGNSEHVCISGKLTIVG